MHGQIKLNTWKMAFALRTSLYFTIEMSRGARRAVTQFSKSAAFKVIVLRNCRQLKRLNKYNKCLNSTWPNN
jgi:hypothetical protein